MKATIKIAILLLCVVVLNVAYAQKPQRETIKLGEDITKRDTTEHRKRRGLTQHLIIPKGEWQVGAQISHVSMSSSNSEYALLINGLDANGSVTKIAPFVSYAFKHNQAIGLRFQYTTADANIDAAELDLLSDDLEWDLENLRGKLNSYQTSVYYRTYIGLDNRGRIGLFNDVALSYNYSKTAFRYNAQTEDAYTKSNQLKLSLHPGIVVFAMNNLSTHVSIGIGGVSYNNTKYYRDGECVGKRDFSKANFKLDILDISIGLSLHL